MPRLNQQQFNVVKRFLNSHVSQVPLNATWRLLHQEYRVGTVRRNQLLLNQNDRGALSALVLADTGVDFKADLQTQTRTAIAASAIDEKWASGSIQDDRIFIASMYDIATTTGVMSLPSGMVAWAAWPELLLNDGQWVVVVENQEAIVHWGRFVLPDALKGALAVYRGHDVSRRAQDTFIEQLPTAVRVARFPDFDPAGFVIAHSEGRCDALVSPENPESIDAPSFHKRFADQWAQYSNYEGKLPAAWLTAWKAMAARSMALSQEAICAREIPLALLH